MKSIHVIKCHVTDILGNKSSGGKPTDCIHLSQPLEGDVLYNTWRLEDNISIDWVTPVCICILYSMKYTDIELWHYKASILLVTLLLIINNTVNGLISFFSMYRTQCK
jgi:hypothetical protein